MAKVTPEEAAAKQAARLKAAVEDMRRGLERVTESPTVKAAGQKDKMLAKLTAKVQDGTWEKNLRAVSTEQWKQAAINVGIPRVAAGIDAAKDKQTQFYSKLLPAVDAARAKVRAMPSTTLEDNINRMTTYIREMAKFKK